MRKMIVAFVTAFALAASPAYADRGRHRGGHHGHHGDNSAWVGLAVIGAIAGLAFMAEQNRPRPAAPYYAEPPYPPQPAYVEPPAYAAPAPAAPGTWYYCRSSDMYYPYTQACPEGWQAVPASPD